MLLYDTIIDVVVIVATATITFRLLLLVINVDLGLCQGNLFPMIMLVGAVGLTWGLVPSREW